MTPITALPLTREAFAPFGEVIEPDDARAYPINAGRCIRHDALARAEARGDGASVVLSIFRARPYDFPLKLAMVERHPFGSQAFMPLSSRPFVVVVCPDGPDGPGEPVAFVTRPGQGVNYPAGLWHGVLTPFGKPQDFLVVDRKGPGSNVEEFHFSHAYEIRLPQGLT